MRVPARPGRATLRRPPVLVLVLPLVLAACGGGGDGPTAAGTTGVGPTTTASTPTVPAVTTTAPRDPAERLAAVSAALRKVRSYHFAGSQTDADGTTRIEGDVTAAGSAILDLTQGDASVEFRIISTTAYLRANAAYWRRNGGAGGAALARGLADRWVKAPAATVGVGELLDELAPRKLAACIAGGGGTLRDGGSSEVAGRRADVLVDPGDRPGSTPSRLFTAAEGAPLPLRLLQTGRRRPGGKLDPECQEADDTTTASDVVFSRFDEPVDVRAPEGALELPGGRDGRADPSES